MSHTPYVVPDHGFGAARTLPINGIDAEVFADLLGSADVRTISVILGTPSASADDTVGLTVRHDGVQIGTIDAHDSAEYTELDWILGAGLSPEVSARLTLDDNGWPLASVVLPAPGLCVPANNPPAVRWAMLDGGVGIPVQGIPTSLASYPREPQHFLVTLRARRFLGHRSVSAYVDGAFIGTLAREDALQLADTIISYHYSGLVSVARGYYKYNEGHPTLTIYADAEAPARKHFAAVAGTAATTGMVLSAAAAARAEAAVPMTGFFTGDAGTAATGASAGATLASVTSLGSSATGSTSATSTAGASATTSSAAATTATTTAATTAAASGVSLQAIAAASTAILTVGGLSVATNNIVNNQPSDAPLTVASGPSTSGSASDPDGDVNTDAQASASSRADSSADSTSTNFTDSDSSTRTNGDRTAGQGSTREATTRAARSAAANDASRQGDAETAQRSATGATATGTNTTGTAPAAVNPTVANQGARPDTNSGISLDELRRLTRDDNLILAQDAPSTTAAASPTTTTTAASAPTTASPLPSTIAVAPTDKALAAPTPTSTAQIEDTTIDSGDVIISDDNGEWAFDFVTPETTTTTASAPATATTTATAAEPTDAPTTSPAESTTTAAPTTAKATATTTAPATSAQATTETATATTTTTAADATDTRSGTRQCGTDFWGIIVYCIIVPIFGGSDTATTTDEPTAEATTPEAIEDPATKAPTVLEPTPLEPTPAVEDTPQELAVETPTETVS
ncbi:hypothetical protein NQ028_08850 [Corynebacterium phoceense]|uniref:hypothetical protein n=1 Tax=Corynebacterium phoceense TaxID=1686286 RepID=UPI00211CD875|nr:hypothetical protein [Corynebacterium phoceense]MCQ9341243.1 hypothetical protein [Corynebacterium phoceense]